MIWIGNGSNVAAAVTISGDATISNTGALTLSNSGVTAATYSSVTVDSKGRVTAGTNPTTLSAYGITDAVQNAGATPSIQTGNDASKPTAGIEGRLYLAKDMLKIYRDNGTSWDVLSNGNATGTVTSVGLSFPTEFNITNSPVTSSGTLTGAWNAQNKNFVFAAPTAANGTPSFRALEASDIPSLDVNKLTGVLPIANGGTGSSSLGSPGVVPRMGATSLISSNITDDGSLITLGSATVLSNANELRFYEQTTNGSNYVGFKASASLSANKLWTLPFADGSNGNVLATDGSGNLGFISTPARSCLAGMINLPNTTEYCIDPSSSSASSYWSASNSCSTNGKHLCTMSEWFNAVKNYGGGSVTYVFGSSPFEWVDYGGVNSATVIKMNSSATDPLTSTDSFTGSYSYRCCFSR
jgi:hypothetical protein